MKNAFSQRKQSFSCRTRGRASAQKCCVLFPTCTVTQIITHHFDLRQHGRLHRLNTLSFLSYLAVREIREMLVLMDQLLLAIPISNISIGNTNTKKIIVQCCTILKKYLQYCQQEYYIAILTTLVARRFFSNIDSGAVVRINCDLNANDFSLQEYQILDLFLSELRSNLIICCPM